LQKQSERQVIHEPRHLNFIFGLNRKLIEIISPIKLFKDILESNVTKLSDMKRLLEQSDLLRKGKYKGIITLELQDAASKNFDDQHPEWYDLLITSPPYGDNRTTIPYGQYSYLPLQWIDLKDIDEHFDSSWISSIYEIDRRSLGGITAKAFKETVELRELSNTFAQTLDALKDNPKDRVSRVAAVCRDLNRCLEPILAKLKPNAYMIWTIGNRRVGNKPVRMDDILAELLKAKGATEIHRIPRKIPSKRMAIKNNFAQTMSDETILIMKKGDS